MRMETIGQYAGTAGVLLAIVAFTFRGVISEKILSHLTPKHAYSIIRLVVILLFVLGIGTIGLSFYPLPGLVTSSPVQARRDQTNIIEAGGDVKMNQTACSEHGNATNIIVAGGNVGGKVGEDLQKATSGGPECPK